MPLHLVCPCGHSVIYPDESMSFACSRCQRVLKVKFFEGKYAYDAWHDWMLSRALAPREERGSVKFIVTSQHSDGLRSSK